MQHDANRPLGEESSPGKAPNDNNDKAAKEGAERADRSRENQGVDGEHAFLAFAGGHAANEARNGSRGADAAEVHSSLQNPIGLQMLSHEGDARNQELQRVDIRQYVQEQLRQKAPILEESDRGYHSSTDPHMDKVSAEMYD